MPLTRSFADLLEDCSRRVASGGQTLVAIAGIPGSGKSTAAASLAREVSGARVLPMDGYHLYRRELDAEGLRRRGAPWTFAFQRFGEDLASLRQKKEGWFPSFDHAHKDPVERAIQVPKECPLVIVEGLYLLLSSWNLSSVFDLTVFLNCDMETAMGRLARRHVESGVTASLEDAYARIDGNDRPNAELILQDGCRERAQWLLN